MSSKMNDIVPIESVPNPENTFHEYGIVSNFLRINGQTTEQQIVFKNQRFVASLDQRYMVLPNEDVEKQLSELAKKLNMTVMEIPSAKWYRKTKDGGLENITKYGVPTKYAGIIQNPEPFEMPDGSKVNLGLAVKNSIDGAWALSASAFTFRHICQNMMIHLSKQKFTNGKYVSLENSNLSKLHDMQVMQVANGVKKHTRSLDLDKVAEVLSVVYDEGKKYIETYKLLAEQKMTQQLGLDIANSMPKWVMDHEPVKEIIQIDTKEKSVKTDTTATKWKAFQSLTEALTHNGRKFDTTLMAYAKLDRIMTPI